jgi:hypothetical protein
MKGLVAGLLLLTLGVVACNSPTPMPTRQASPTPTRQASAYPVVQRPTSSLPQGPRFTLSRPLYAGDTVVRGQGPANVPVRIVDASLIVDQSAAATLGQGVIGADGQFGITVNPPLSKDHLTAIQIGDLSGTSLKYGDFLSGEGYSDRPMVGVVFDIAVVAERPQATPAK